MSCLLHAKYNMKMDILRQRVFQNEAGELEREWSPLAQDIDCIARGISGGGIRVVGSTERWGAVHEDVEFVKIQCNYNVSKRDQITNIRSKNGILAWEDNGEAITFNVVGSSPVMDPFGNLVEYDLLVTRAELQ